MSDHEIANQPHADIALRDLSPWLSWWLPFGVFALAFLTLVLYLAFGLPWFMVLFLAKEGPIEYAAVLVLLLGIFYGIGAFMFRRRLPTRHRTWLSVWLIVFCLGCVYFTGEELSWGYHIRTQFFGKARTGQPKQTFLGVNEQGETNIHNIDKWWAKLFGRSSKYILEFGWVYVASLILPLLLRDRKPPLLPQSDGHYWLWPSMATCGSAALVFLSYRPWRWTMKLLDIEATGWRRHSEIQEFFIATTLMLYLASFYTRLRQMPAQKSSGESGH